MKKDSAIKLLGLAAMALGGVATLVGNWVQERQMEQMINEKVQEALAEREEQEDEEES